MPLENDEKQNAPRKWREHIFSTGHFSFILISRDNFSSPRYKTCARAVLSGEKKIITIHRLFFSLLLF